MAATHKALCIFPLLFIAASAQSLGLGEEEAPHLPNPFQFIGRIFHPFGYSPANNGDSNGGNAADDDEGNDVDSKGEWELVLPDSGVSAMHINLLPNNKIILFDATSFHVSRIKLPQGVPCIQYQNDKGEKGTDCWAHGVEYDVLKRKIRPLKVEYDPWCSSGGLAPDGTLVNVGGFQSGVKAVRFIGTCENCDFREYPDAVKEERWYGTQVILPNGDFIIMGGRRAYSYEFIPKEGQNSPKPYFFPFLYETSDVDENNLYPFIHLSTDGNLFVFANNRSLLLNPTTNKIVRTLPVLEGGSRNYPASGMSALLPIKLDIDNNIISTTEVIVCGGALPTAFRTAENEKRFLPALQDCARLDITTPGADWDKELMPSRRVMGDMLILPTGDLLILNGAEAGTAAWNDAEKPNLKPVLYSLEKPKGKRFKELNPTQIPRMYHSSSAVLPNGEIFVAGSNTNPTYMYENVKYPTEVRIEEFSPPYLAKPLQKRTPEIVKGSLGNQLKYGQKFGFQFKLSGKEEIKQDKIKVTMYFPPFTTHGYSMSQRMLVLGITGITQNGDNGVSDIEALAPPSGVIAPPGYYLLFVVNNGVPSTGEWVKIQ